MACGHSARIFRRKLARQEGDGRCHESSLPALSRRWGFYHPDTGGKIVWAALDIITAPSDTRGAWS
jgi:hypothetical protein